jgi:hypothetical protein
LISVAAFGLDVRHLPLVELMDCVTDRAGNCCRHANGMVGVLRQYSGPPSTARARPRVGCRGERPPRPFPVGVYECDYA